jgi:hypothetical protein
MCVINIICIIYYVVFFFLYIETNLFFHYFLLKKNLFLHKMKRSRRIEVEDDEENQVDEVLKWWNWTYRKYVSMKAAAERNPNLGFSEWIWYLYSR